MVSSKLEAYRTEAPRDDGGPMWPRIRGGAESVQGKVALVPELGLDLGENLGGGTFPDFLQEEGDRLRSHGPTGVDEGLLEQGSGYRNSHLGGSSLV